MVDTVTMEARSMPRRKPNAEDPSFAEGGQVNFKASSGLMRRLQAVAAGLGLDMANLCRMIVTENLRIYEDRVRRVAAEEEEGQAP